MTDTQATPSEPSKADLGAPRVTIDWYRSTPWWRVLQPVLPISWRTSHVLVCSAGLLLTELSQRLTHWIFSPERINPSWIRASMLYYSPLASQVECGSPTYLNVWQNFLSPVWGWILTPTLRNTACMLAQFLCFIAIWSLVGGCLTRRTIVECGTRATAPWGDTIRLVMRRWQSIVWSISMPVCVIAMILVLPLLLGWISNIPGIGWILAAILLVPLSIAALGVAWLAAISVFGFPLSVCAIVTERKADAFDGLSRAAAQLFQRPLILLLLVLAAQLVSVASSEIVGSIVWVGRSVLQIGFQWGATEETVSSQIALLKGIPTLLVAGFGFSFFWSVAGAVYLIVRKDLDRAEYDLIDFPSNDLAPVSGGSSASDPTKPEPNPQLSLPNSDASTDVG